MNKIRRQLLLLSQFEHKSDGGFFLGVSRNANASNNLAYSFDCGNTWVYKTTNSEDNYLRVSQGLKTWVISGYHGARQYSLDNGKTFNTLPINIDYCTISNDGNVIVGVNSMENRSTYKFVYPFTSYTQIYTATQDVWTPPTLNYDGSLIVARTNSNKSAWKYDNGNTSIILNLNNTMNQPDIAAVSNIIYISSNGTLYKSIDRGSTFTIIQQNLSTDLGFDDGGSNHVSNSGEYFILHAQNGNKVGVFWNYGADYKIINTSSGRVFSSCSSSGKYMAYTVGMNIFVSTDYGQTFNQIATPKNLTTSGQVTTITIEDI